MRGRAFRIVETAEERPRMSTNGTQALANRSSGSNYLQRGPSPSGLADVLELILDKGLVIDAYVRVSVIGIELLTVDARIVIASVDTYLRFAEAVNRLDLSDDQATFQDLVASSEREAGKKEAESAIEGAGHRLKEKVTRS
jgi:gas vesicle structural protein